MNVSWDQLLEIRRQVREAARDEWELREHPLACPNDGTPLEVGAAGEISLPVLPLDESVTVYDPQSASLHARRVWQAEQDQLHGLSGHHDHDGSRG
jgi:hypothetical protein